MPSLELERFFSGLCLAGIAILAVGAFLALLETRWAVIFIAGGIVGLAIGIVGPLVMDKTSGG